MNDYIDDIDTFFLYQLTDTLKEMFGKVKEKLSGINFSDFKL